MNDFEDSFEAETPVDDAQAETPEVAVEEPQIETPEAVEAEPAPVVEEQAPSAQSEAEKALLGVVTSMRHELRELKAAQMPKEPVKIPDVFEDQAGFAQTIQQQFASQMQNQHLNVSESLARSAHGDAVVDEAVLALQNSGDPSLHQSITSAPMPFDALVKWHKQQKFAQQVGPDPDAYLERQKAQWKAEYEAGLVAKQSAQPLAAAPSLAHETSIGGRSSATAPTLTPLDDLLA